MAPLDPYIEPGTSTLKNLLGLRNLRELAAAEADLVNARTVQLGDLEFETFIPNSRDERELRAIHYHLFQDIYPFAGEIRTIDMRRGDGELFAPCAGISQNLFSLAEQLNDKNLLRNLGRNEFLKELVYFYSMLNWIHPFREGNGRTQRLFWSRVALDAGWLLDWRQFGTDLNEASRISREQNDDSLLFEGFESIIFRAADCELDGR